jgi:hypothetical protein
MTAWFEDLKQEFIDKAKIHGSVTLCETELNTDGTGDVPHAIIKIRVNKPKEDKAYKASLNPYKTNSKSEKEI